MTAVALPFRLELRKQRRGRLVSYTVLIFGLWAMWTAGLVSHRAGNGGSFAGLEFAFLDVMGMAELFSPIFIAVAAAQLVAVDHQERIGQVFDALGQPRWLRFVAKLVILNLLSAAGSLLLVGVSLGVGRANGMSAGPELAAVATRGMLVLLLAAVPVAAVQLALAMRFPERPVTLIVGVVGAFVASSLSPLRIAEVGWLLPWGILVGASPVERSYRFADRLQLLTGTTASDTALLVVLAAAWTAAAIWYTTRTRELS
ncbi:MAG: hypothetical protein Q4D79_05630 [Propionibacteriaceae bacterium]|nr:hypothetical protein [Propionibacteriaceae bacterium]